jgi:hypothetical protein
MRPNGRVVASIPVRCFFMLTYRDLRVTGSMAGEYGLYCLKVLSLDSLHCIALRKCLIIFVS